MVEMNRNYCILIGQLLFLTVVGARDRLEALPCAIITSLAHFVWLAAFAWIGTMFFSLVENHSQPFFFPAVEGYMLFVALVVVFDRGQTGKRWHFFAICYVAAAAIAGITVGIAGGKSEIYDGYFREDACWLDGGYLWAFIGPVAVVLVFNTVILVKALMEAYRVRTRKFRGKKAFL